MDQYQLLLKKIDDYIRKYYLNKVYRGCIWLITFSFITYLIIINIEFFAYLNPIIKTIIIYCYIAAFSVLAYLLIIKYLLLYNHLGKRISHVQASKLIGIHFPNIQDKLLNTLQLKEQTIFDQSGSLIIESINQKINELNPISFSKAINLKQNLPFLKYFIFSLGIFFSLFIIKPSLIKEGTTRIILYDKIYFKPAPFNFELLNTDLNIIEGENITLKLRTSGKVLPNEVFIVEGDKTFKLIKIDATTFEHTFNNLPHSVNFKFKSDDYYSSTYHIKVYPKATIKKYQVTIKYPAYTKIKSNKIENFSDLNLPEGSSIHIKLDLAKSNHIFLTTNHKIYKLKKNKNNYISFQQTINNNVNNVFKLNNKVLSEQKIICKKDYSPIINFNTDKDSTLNTVLFLSGNVSDDYGLSDISLHYRILSSNTISRRGKHYKLKLNFKFVNGIAPILFLWDTNKFKFEKGEKIEYYLSATDNDGINGPKTSFSDKKILALNTTEQNQKAIEKNFADINKEISKAKIMSKEIQKQAKDISLELLQKNKLDEDLKNNISSMIKKDEDLKKQLEEIKRLTQKSDLTQKTINDQDKLSALMQKDLQKLTDNILDEKTKTLLDALKKLIEQNDTKKIKETLSKAPLENKLLEKELDRLLNLYKELEFKQKAKNISESLKKLADDQNKLSDKLNENNTLEKQNAIKEEFSHLQNDINALKEKNLKEAQNKDLSALNNENLKKAENSIENSIAQLKSKQSSKAAKTQKETAELLQKMSDQLSFSMSSDEDEQNELDEQQLKILRKNLLNTSYRQEKIRENLRETHIDDPQFQMIAKEQKILSSNLRMFQDTLYEISKNVPELQSSVNFEFENIAQISQQLNNQFTERNKLEVLKSEKIVLTSINNLILVIDEVIDKLKNSNKSGSSGKGKPSLKQISQMQQQLNDNMQKAKKQLEQKGNSSEQSQNKQGDSKLFSDLAQKQQEIREALESLDKAQKMEGLGGIDGVGNAIKQMEQTENDLVYKKISNEILLRQKQIEIKLLESEKAQQERESSTKKESDIPNNISPLFIKKWEEYKKNMNKDFEIYKTISPTLNQFYKEKLDIYYKNLNSK